MNIPRPTILSACLGIALACGPMAALAAPAAAGATAVEPPSIAGEVLGILLPLAFIIVVLVAVLYFIRRRFGLTGRDAPLSIVQILPVGSRERIVVVKSRSGRVFAVGVGSQNVTLITNLEQSDGEPVSTPEPASQARPVI